MRRILALAFALALTLVAGVASAAPPPPGPGLVLGVQDDRLPVADAPRLTSGLDHLAAARVTASRVDVLWSQVAPTRPADGADHADAAYRWATYDAILRGLAARGIEPVLDVYGTPGWAADPAFAGRNGPDAGRRAPEPAAYGAFMAALATRYSGVATDAAGALLPRARMYEPWNEPNLAFFLRPQWTDPGTGALAPASPAVYAELLRRAHAAVHAAQPDAVVIGLATGSSGDAPPPPADPSAGSVGVTTFVRALAAMDPPVPMEAYSQHLYPVAAPSEPSPALLSFARLPDLIALLDELRPGLPLLITEFGYLTAAPAANPNRAGIVTFDRQAANLADAVRVMSLQPRIRLAIWFNLQDNVGWPAGLRTEADAPKPAWDALTALLAPPPPPPHPARRAAAPSAASAGSGLTTPRGWGAG